MCVGIVGVPQKTEGLRVLGNKVIFGVVPFSVDMGKDQVVFRADTESSC